ncbi:MAG: arginine repressor [Caldisericum sp.]|nr:arginine repressor [Caldisericum sp.]
MKNYEKRLRLIREILQREKVKSEKELQELLLRNHIKVTQATIARDFKKLNVVKVRDENGFYYTILKEEKENLGSSLKIAFKNFVKGIDSEENLILIFTSPGNASGVANIIDSMHIEGVVGTVAGDDTILVVTRKEKTQEVIEKFKSYI